MNYKDQTKMPDAGYLRANATIKRQVPILLDQDAAQVIRALRDQGCLTARDFSLITGWSKAKTFQVLHHLIDDKLIIQTGEAMSIGGRKPRLICLNQNLGYLVGIDIGATSIDVVISDVRGRILQRINEAADVRLKPELFLNRCIELVHQVAATQGCQPDEILS
ncbi:MAG: hypothetical protein ACPL1K_07660, partial [Candidatus Kryptoniota bacterium]